MSDNEEVSAEHVSEQQEQPKSLDPVETAIKEKVTSKKPRSPKQIEAMQRAQKARTENLRKMKELQLQKEKEDKKNEKKLAQEQAAKDAAAIIQRYEAEKKRVAEEKKLARQAKAREKQLQKEEERFNKAPSRGQYNKPHESAVRAKSSKPYVDVVFDNRETLPAEYISESEESESSEDEFMGIFGRRH
ncbi:hypothetical protein PhCBS80983_g06401 [Powellomyces hirtus]|uniref:Uncharacterized protein n=1 Tax=Powellomyces hirtus TaxID=109895 RepID=A0A507DNE3_9FUNG|nr:hypothetical protein PhCBS80983_g06401 [Powellomyces hirtus]